MTRSLFPLEYTSDFIEARKAYKPPPNCSRPDAMKAWVQIKSARPEQPLMLACIKAYGEYLDTENAQRAKFKQSPHPKKHMSSWLRGLCFEGFLERGKQMLETEARKKNEAAQSAARLSDPTNPNAQAWERLRKEIGDETTFNVWFAAAEYNAEANRLTVPRPFLATQIQRKFIGAIRRSFNQDTLVMVCVPSP